MPVCTLNLLKMVFKGARPPSEIPIHTIGKSIFVAVSFAFASTVGIGIFLPHRDKWPAALRRLACPNSFQTRSPSKLLTPNGQNWTIRMCEDLVSSRYRQVRGRAGNAGLRLCAKNDQIGVTQICQIQNAFSRFAAFDEAFGLAPKRRFLQHELTQTLFLGVSNVAPGYEFSGFRFGHHVQQLQVRLKLLGKRNSVSGSQRSLRSEIGREKDFPDLGLGRVGTRADGCFSRPHSCVTGKFGSMTAITDSSDCNPVVSREEIMASS